MISSGLFALVISSAFCYLSDFFAIFVIAFCLSVTLIKVRHTRDTVLAVKTSAFFFISKKNLEKIDLLLSIFICSRILKSRTAINIPKQKGVYHWCPSKIKFNFLPIRLERIWKDINILVKNTSYIINKFYILKNNIVSLLSN